MRIEGEISFSLIRAAFSNATVIIKIEDTQRADAPATLIFEQRLTGVSRAPDKCGPVPFAFDLPTTKRLSACSLRVHVDVRSTGDVTLDDYVSSRNYSINGVLPQQYLEIIVDPVQ